MLNNKKNAVQFEKCKQFHKIFCSRNSVFSYPILSFKPNVFLTQGYFK